MALEDPREPVWTESLGEEVDEVGVDNYRTINNKKNAKKMGISVAILEKMVALPQFWRENSNIFFMLFGPKWKPVTNSFTGF